MKCSALIVHWKLHRIVIRNTEYIRQCGTNGTPFQSSSFSALVLIQTPSLHYQWVSTHARSSGLPSFPCPLPIHPSRQEFSSFSPFPPAASDIESSLDQTSTRQHHIPTHPNHKVCIGGLQSLRFALLEKPINTRSLSIEFTLLSPSLLSFTILPGLLCDGPIQPQIWLRLTFWSPHDFK